MIFRRLYCMVFGHQTINVHCTEDDEFFLWCVCCTRRVKDGTPVTIPE